MPETTALDGFRPDRYEGADGADPDRAAYLVLLGVGMLTGPATAAVADEGSEAGSWLPQAATGWGTSGLNPKVFLLFLALLPQFIDTRAAWPVAAQIVTLGLLHVASTGE